MAGNMNFGENVSFHINTLILAVFTLWKTVLSWNQLVKSLPGPQWPNCSNSVQPIVKRIIVSVGEQVCDWLEWPTRRIKLAYGYAMSGRLIQLEVCIYHAQAKNNLVIMGIFI